MYLRNPSATKFTASHGNRGSTLNKVRADQVSTGRGVVLTARGLLSVYVFSHAQFTSTSI
jgi:hypothetical protein